jgi:tetratricopeptide (TPR) repeat protein
VQGVIGTPTDLTVPEPVARARDCLESLTNREPRNAAAWATLVLVFNSQRNGGFALPPEQKASIDRRLYLADKAVEAANRAIEIAPNDAFVRGLVARAAWMACQPDLLRIETMRAIALNPNDPQNLGPLGNLLAYTGSWDEGVSLAEKGIALTAPGTPRWWRWVIAKRSWARGQYQLAFDTFRESYIEQLWLSHVQMACTLPFLDRTDEAKGTRCDFVEDEARIHDPRGGRLLQNVVFRAVVSREDAGCSANRRAPAVKACRLEDFLNGRNG